ncbi:MAG: hypothetical protein C0490_22535, partial [Marivirga sp.]|nr:hypothetical protein [Marivirga sp.]
MVIPKDTPYKVLSFLNRFFLERSIKENYLNEKLLIHLNNRGHISRTNGQIHTSAKFEDIYLNEIQPLYLELQKFIDLHNLQKIQNHYTIGDVECLKLIAAEKDRIMATGLSFQQILSMYFNSSKYTQLNSNLANAIKTVLGISTFYEDEKDQQYISILHPSQISQVIILCENKNRLKIPRHPYVEFWYGGGRNVGQLAFSPRPTIPMFYLFDWDHHGVSILSEIRNKYFPKIHAFIPNDFRSLYVDQEKIKNHNSVWTTDSKTMLPGLTEEERTIVSELIGAGKVIEEQRISIS